MSSHASRTKKVVSSCKSSLHLVQRAHTGGNYFFRSRSRDRGSWCWCGTRHYVCRRAIAPASVVIIVLNVQEGVVAAAEGVYSDIIIK